MPWSMTGRAPGFSTHLPGGSRLQHLLVEEKTLTGTLALCMVLRVLLDLQGG